MVLLEFSMSPMDKGESVSKYVSRSLNIVDESGVDYRLNPMGTVLEGEWDEVQRQKHINVLEMEAVLIALKQLQDRLRSRKVMIVSDNTSVVSYLKRQGGMKSRELMIMALKVLELAEENCITVSCCHIAGELKVWADYLSRGRKVAKTEWSLHPRICQVIWNMWDKPMSDMFAAKWNRKLPCYVSPFPDPEAWAIDAFSIQWTGLYFYAFPPTRIIAKVLTRMWTQVV